MTAIAGIGRISGAVVLALGVAIAALPSMADGNRVPRVDDYDDSLSKVSVGNESPNGQFWFHAGLLTGLHWANHEYVKARAEPRFCLPKSFQPIDLRDLVVAQLSKNGATWREARAPVALVALFAVTEKFPC